MKVVVISYSYTGNNEALANSIAAEFVAEQIKITEPKPRTMGTIILDMLLNRMPRVNQNLDNVGEYDLVLFVGPVWMGQVATPLRACFKKLKSKLSRLPDSQYAFISISGGAIGPNQKVAGELKKRLGKEPTAVIDLHIADLLPSAPKPTIKDTSAYRLCDGEVKSLTHTIVKTLRETLAR